MLLTAKKKKNVSDPNLNPSSTLHKGPSLSLDYPRRGRDPEAHQTLARLPSHFGAIHVLEEAGTQSPGTCGRKESVLQRDLPARGQE